MAFPKVKFRVGNETLVGQIFSNDALGKPRILFLHGAGKATKEKAYPIAEKLLEHELASFGFDFSGHGESTGNLHESSLRKRVAEAQAALAFLSTSEPVSICAFSMGGHIALELMKTNPIKNLVLFYPAIYAPEAFSIPFDERFSDIIRQTDSWKRADAVNVLSNFTGKLLICIGDRDEIIPRGVIDMMDRKSSVAAHKEIFIIPGAEHQFLEALDRNSALMNTLIDKIMQFSL